MCTTMQRKVHNAAVISKRVNVTLFMSMLNHPSYLWTVQSAFVSICISISFSPCHRVFVYLYICTFVYLCICMIA